MRGGKRYYPYLSQLHRRMDFEDVSSDESVASLSGSDSSAGTINNTEVVTIGVDPSIGKDHKLLGTATKNVTVLGNGILPSNVGKKTVTLFLE